MSQPQVSNRPLIITAMLLGMLMASLDNTIVSTAMPTVVSELGGLDIFSWVFSAYLLTSTTFIPIFGKLADLYGKKQFYVLGLVVFVLGSYLSGTSETMSQLIAFRAIQGFGAAAMFPITYAMIIEIFPIEQRGKMQGLFSAIFGLASAIGPTIGGYFTEYFSWHWIFYVNVPIGVVAILLILVYYKNLTVRDKSKKIVIDYTGSITLTLSILALMYGLASAGKQYEWGSWQIISLLGASLVLLIAFFFIERRAVDPIIPLQLFKNNGVVSSNASAFLMGAILLGGASYIPLFIQGVIGGSATKAGDLVTPMMIGLVVGSGAAGAMMQRMPYRPIQVVSSLIMAGGAFMLSRLNLDSTNLYVVISMVVLGIGLGPLFPIPIAMMQGTVTQAQVSIASSLISFQRNIGMAIGISLLSLIVNNKMANAVTDAFQGTTIPADKLEHLKDPRALFSEQARAMIPQDVFHQLQIALSDSISIVFLVIMGLCLACAVFGIVAGDRAEQNYTARKAKQQAKQSM
ncbi:MDR family MFS transporter [Tumebacillus permanentifrigoris]|uniref:EmrB/QacA subfamily drug resistance transporter n=1 Tax=Tumebacillus permanentifrigoris TaxID=378543 RepID=A0A316DBI1_9BACL|nr:MDR family MFS transporter [Tumebacillus permanentifrigoris]PWK13384.1 EmrB/QacA subfamily drug resistance transporter [Tumebacillus permanentifrigoris]